MAFLLAGTTSTNPVLAILGCTADPRLEERWLHRPGSLAPAAAGHAMEAEGTGARQGQRWNAGTRDTMS